MTEMTDAELLEKFAKRLATDADRLGGDAGGFDRIVEKHLARAAQLRAIAAKLAAPAKVAGLSAKVWAFARASHENSAEADTMARELDDALTALIAERDGLREALTFYAEVRQYNPVGGGTMIPILEEKGANARAALANPQPEESR